VNGDLQMTVRWSRGKTLENQLKSIGLAFPLINVNYTSLRLHLGQRLVLLLVDFERNFQGHGHVPRSGTCLGCGNSRIQKGLSNQIPI
jgi:hypothetical protein